MLKKLQTAMVLRRKAKVKVNSATASVAISEDSRAAVAEHYREVYEYMADFMPQTRELWGGFKYL